MRCRKYRAWDFFNAEMFYSGVIADSKSVFFADIAKRISGGNNIDEMDFTGLKDKNNVDIYEGDILCHPYFDYPIVVEWNQKDCGFESMGLPSEWHNCDVVGNIYENTEILNDQQNQ